MPPGILTTNQCPQNATGVALAPPQVPAAPRYRIQDSPIVDLRLLPSCAHLDRELLLDLKGAFDNGAELLPTWGGNASDPCAPEGPKWEGVTCDSGHRVSKMWVGAGLLLGSCTVACADKC